MTSCFAACDKERFGIFRRKKQTAPARAEWLIVGLGNPGRKYEVTRHNAGFLAVDLLCQKLGVRADKVRCKALTAPARLAGMDVVLCKPQTYMNLSGEAVRDLAAALEVPPQRIVVIFDDADMVPGRVRVRRGGSAGGHNGIKSIIYHLGSDQFPRVKIGIGAPNRAQEDMADYVLSPMDSDTWAAIRLAPDIVEAILRDGVDKAMQVYNASSKTED